MNGIEEVLDGIGKSIKELFSRKDYFYKIGTNFIEDLRKGKNINIHLLELDKILKEWNKKRKIDFFRRFLYYVLAFERNVWLYKLRSDNTIAQNLRRYMEKLREIWDIICKDEKVIEYLRGR